MRGPNSRQDDGVDRARAPLLLAAMSGCLAPDAPLWRLSSGSLVSPGGL